MSYKFQKGKAFRSDAEDLTDFSTQFHTPYGKHTIHVSYIIKEVFLSSTFLGNLDLHIPMIIWEA